MKKYLLFGVVCCVVFSVGAVAHAGNHSSGGPSAGAIVADALVLRPLGFCGTVLGAAAFVISLPVTLPTRRTDEASRILVVTPYQYTFERPLGRM